MSNILKSPLFDMTPTNRDKSAVWALLDEVGQPTSTNFFARHGAKQGASGFSICYGK